MIRLMPLSGMFSWMHNGKYSKKRKNGIKTSEQFSVLEILPFWENHLSNMYLINFLLTSTKLSISGYSSMISWAACNFKIFTFSI